jgi:hypothetical protein
MIGAFGEDQRRARPRRQDGLLEIGEIGALPDGRCGRDRFEKTDLIGRQPPLRLTLRGRAPLRHLAPPRLFFSCWYVITP